MNGLDNDDTGNGNTLSVHQRNMLLFYTKINDPILHISNGVLRLIRSMQLGEQYCKIRRYNQWYILLGFEAHSSTKQLYIDVLIMYILTSLQERHVVNMTLISYIALVIVYYTK